jgi:hypothetical protein
MPRFFELLQGAVQSVRDKPQGRRVSLGVLDLGLLPEQRRWLAARVDAVREPNWHFDFPGRDSAPTWLCGLLARAFLPHYFPGADLYLWLDADAWVQDWAAVELFLQGASRRGLAIVPEVDRSSQQQYGGLPRYWELTRSLYETAFGARARDLYSYPTLNAGVFALSWAAPHWQRWADCLGMALQRTCDLFTDQVALNYAVYRCGLFEQTELLPAWCNWTCHAGLRAWDPARGRLVEPYLPHTPIGVLHLTCQKHLRAAVPSTAGGQVEVSLRYAPPDGVDTPDREGELSPPVTINGPLPPGDYVSPGLEVIVPDRCFPHLTRGDTARCRFPFLRREIPHPWYVDRRAPEVGFVSRDEAAILYNTALRFRGLPALEIGCWLGWSACHLALAGVRLDVIDPLLGQPEILGSVRDSLGTAGVLPSVHLVPGSSPEAVEELAARSGRRWCLYFIDGDHGAPARERDAAVCERHAAEDAVILFHDLACPDVAAGLDYLRRRGWKTLVYQTMQIMGAAWRGRVSPVPHTPDPSVRWTLPGHLQGHPLG